MTQGGSLMAPTKISMAELLNSDGFIGKLIVRSTSPESVVTMRIDEMESSGATLGQFDLLGTDADGNIHLVDGVFIHEIEDMYVGECHPDCEECNALLGGETK
jgi:hypothetical protein